MADMLGDAMVTLNGWLDDFAGKSVTYKRGAATAPVTATVGYSVLRQGNTEGLANVVRTDRDFLISVSGLVVGDSAITPRDGDKIVEVVDGVTRTYEVGPPFDGEPSWRYSDPHRQRYRIHTKAVPNS